MSHAPDHDGETVPNNVVPVRATRPLPWRVEPAHGDDRRPTYTVCDAAGTVVCRCDVADDGRAEAVEICTAVNRAGPQVCECGQPATCFGSYETDLNPAYACSECCGHGCEDGHCELL